MKSPDYNSYPAPKLLADLFSSTGITCGWGVARLRLFRSLSPDLFLWMSFPIVTIALADVLPVAIVVAEQPIHCQGVCPYPSHLFIDVLTKVGDVKNATAIVQVRINQVFPDAFEHR